MEQRITKLTIVIISVLLSLAGSFSTVAQGQPKHFYAYEGICCSFLQEDQGSIGVDASIGYRFKNLSLFVPVSVTERLYAMSTTKNYDFQGLLGLGLSERIRINNDYNVELVALAQSTYLHKECLFKYATGKVEARWAKKRRIGFQTFGLGVQYYKMYDGSLGQDGASPCISVGWLF